MSKLTNDDLDSLLGSFKYILTSDDPRYFEVLKASGLTEADLKKKMESFKESPPQDLLSDQELLAVQRDVQRSRGLT